MTEIPFIIKDSFTCHICGENVGTPAQLRDHLESVHKFYDRPPNL